MTRTIIITDITQFKPDKDLVCIAGLDIASGECIRPQPYYTLTQCKQDGILPGFKLQGDFSLSGSASAPHLEDYNHTNTHHLGNATTQEFKQILINNASPSLQAGFGVPLQANQKLIYDYDVNNILASIITIQINPTSVYVHLDDKGRLRINFTDGSNNRFIDIPFKDIRYIDYYFRKQTQIALSLITLNAFLRAQEQLFIRVGIGRIWASSQSRGYWFQVNGVYSFPQCWPQVIAYDL
ncbi:hypothetical protein [Methyloradius palustris]|uniref:Uncharacterized protein n=1 Tax=Methyloradius palustris TaxID=2778876 RepID=A0A8D5G288_9PROT|nr:hypothetical protein [Methyloradius palustris]BCM24345.1 hypothetical protein ZMTM_06040 [Methyloradius palustris]